MATSKKSRLRATQRFVLGEDIDLDRSKVRDRTGKRISEKEAQIIAKQTIRSIGRPSLSGRPRQSPEIKARVPSSLKRRIEIVAKRRGISKSSLIREALERYIKSA